MLSALVIVFREMLEMALVIGVLLAATRGLKGSRHWIGLGIFAGFFGALVVALFMEEMEAAVSGNGEFIFNAVVLLIAASLIAWTVIWMSQHSRQMSANMRRIGSSVSEGSLPTTALAIVAFSAVMREGAEAVFFLFGAAKTIASGGWSLLAGGLLGAIAALLIGTVIYLGLSRIRLSRLFTVASWLLIFMAAGMVSQASANLVIIEWLPALVDQVWDTSTILTQESLTGSFLHVMIGYDPAPSGIQLVTFVSAFILMASLYLRNQQPGSQQKIGGGMPQAKPAH